MWKYLTANDLYLVEEYFEKTEPTIGISTYIAGNMIAKYEVTIH